VFTALGQQAPEPRAEGGSRVARGAGVWVFQDGRLTRIPVEPGINDGTTTAVAGGALQEGSQVVTAVAAKAAATTTQGAGSPLLPQRPNRARAQQGSSR
jgi:hypothetical protein